MFQLDFIVDLLQMYLQTHLLTSVGDFQIRWPEPFQCTLHLTYSKIFPLLSHLSDSLVVSILGSKDYQNLKN